MPDHVWRIDGIEESIARVEEDGERMIALPSHLLPGGAKEGQRLRVTRTPAGKRRLVLVIEIDEDATAAELASSRTQTAAVAAESKKHDPGGNVAL